MGWCFCEKPFAQHGECHSHEAVVPTIPKRMGQESQAFGTEIPSVWDENPKRMGQESQTLETDSGQRPDASSMGFGIRQKRDGLHFWSHLADRFSFPFFEHFNLCIIFAP